MAIYKRKGRTGSWKNSSARTYRRKRYGSAANNRRRRTTAKPGQRVSVNVFFGSTARKTKRR